MGKIKKGRTLIQHRALILKNMLLKYFNSEKKINNFISFLEEFEKRWFPEEKGRHMPPPSLTLHYLVYLDKL